MGEITKDVIDDYKALYELTDENGNKHLDAQAALKEISRLREERQANPMHWKDDND